MNQEDDNIQIADHPGNHTMLHDVERRRKATNVELFLLNPSKYLVRALKPKTKPSLDSRGWSDTGLPMAKMKK